MKTYYFPLLLLSSALLGAFSGQLFGPHMTSLKPLGDLFLNVLLTAIVPLVFFSIAGTVARLGNVQRLWKVMQNMLLTFVGTGVIAAVFMLLILKILPAMDTSAFHLQAAPQVAPVAMLDNIVKTLTVPEFYKLFSHHHLLPLILFALLVGIASLLAGEQGKKFSAFLDAGAAVLQQVMRIVMFCAPVGFFAFFAVLVADAGQGLFQHYLYITLIYYIVGCLYFIFAFSFYAYLANGSRGVTLFWRNVFVPMLTSFGTCSSVACIPANLKASKNIGISPSVYETVIPMGAVLHKDGSVMGGILKIVFLFSILHLDFTGLSVLVMAVGVGLMVGLVMGAIPSGGMLGEVFILSAYGFPPETLMLIAAISIIIDPLATMLNCTGDIVACMMTAKLSETSKSKTTLQAECYTKDTSL